jgi:hypothetical protein
MLQAVVVRTTCAPAVIPTGLAQERTSDLGICALRPGWGSGVSSVRITRPFSLEILFWCSEFSVPRAYTCLLHQSIERAYEQNKLERR